MKNQKKGLTLVELLVVIVIIGILAAISIGTFVRYQEKARLAKAKGIATQIKRQFAVKNILLADPNKSFQFKFLTTDDPNSYPILENSGSQLNLDKVEWRGGAAQIINDQTLGLKNVLSINQSQFIASFNQPFRTDTFTISFWLKNHLEPNHPEIAYPFFISQGTNGGIMMGLYQNKITFLMSSHRYPNNESYLEYPLMTGKWHHVIGTYGNGTAKLWVDGYLVGTQEGITHDLTVNAFTRLILGYTYYSPTFQGELKDVMFIPKVFNGTDFE